MASISHTFPKSRPGFEFSVLFTSYVGSGNFHEVHEWEIVLLGSADTTEEGAKGRAFAEAAKFIYAEVDEVVIDADENNPARPVTVAVSQVGNGKAYKVRFTTRQYWV